MKVLFLVIARGGSKSVPGKNLRVLGGIPLVAFKIISGLRSRYCSRLILSSDDPEIQRVGRAHGAEVPFTRPAHLATDTASSDAVALHAMQFVEQEGKERYEALMLLESAAPFAAAAEYDRAVELMQARNANLVVGMVEQKINRVFVGEMDERGGMGAIIRQMNALTRLDRQALSRNYTMNGAFYLMKWDHYRKAERRYGDEVNTYGVVMSPYHSIEIDEPIDLQWAEFLVERGYIDLSPWK